MRSYHKLRKAVHAGCFAVFVALPFLDAMRFDIPRQRFYIAGQELWISEFAIIFFSLMFLMFLVIVSAIFYGRIYCGYLCPQMIFSEASVALEKRLHRRKKYLARPLFYAALAPASVFLAFVFLSYFVEPGDLLRRLASLDVTTAAGFTGAAVTLITFLDFTLVRQRFCTTVCPYGYLQGILADPNTLLVVYSDQQRECIECKKCVRVCQMGIDIRKSPHQIECVHCGDCIDACEDVLGRLGKPGLIHYAWGESAEPDSAPAWHRRIGVRDAKRVVILLVLLFYGSGLFVALAMRQPVLVRITPDRARLYRAGADGRIYNQFRYRIANRSGRKAAVMFRIEGLAGSTLAIAPNPVAVEPGEEREGQFEIAAARGSASRDVNHFRIVANSEDFPMTFLMPAEESAQ